MAANRGSVESGMENKQGIRAAEISPQGQIIRNFKECFSCLLHSIKEFGSELKTSENQPVNITANESDFNLDDIKPSHLYSCLQRHISKLQGVSAYLKQIVDSETMLNNEATEKSRKDLATTSEVDLVTDAGVVPATSHLSFGVNDTMKAQVDDSSVQIKAGKAEIERRISAFIERKQLEINENNVREFCNVINCNQENSCARTDAVFTPYPGFRSHVKVTRVVNTYGPQTQGRHSDQGVQQQGLYSRDCGNPAIEERLHNIEAHLNLTAAGPVPHSIYQRLKKLEDRILELEGLSPEYFHSTSYSHKRLKASVSQSYSLSELDGKISAVRTALLKRASEFQSSDMRVPL